MAVDLGLLTPEQVDECRSIHRTLLDLGVSGSLAEVCVRKGYLSGQQVASVESALGRRADLVFPGYEILGKIAEGGMGVVYRARQVSMDRVVALKVLSPKFANDVAGRERFLREARAIARLNHPNVVAGIDAGEAGGTFYLVMEFVDGESMDTVLRRRGALPWREAVAIARQVATALEHAERHALVHRDIKPANIMLLADGVAKLADLGLARVIEAEDATLTQTGMIVGSPAYLSPEQARGEATLDIRSDVYSLGLSLYEFIAGQRAFAGSNPLSVLTELLTRDVAMERLRAAGAPPGLVAVLARMTQRDRERRYPGPRPLLEDLDAVLADRAPPNAALPDVGGDGDHGIPAAARPPGRARVDPSRVRLFIAAALVAVALVVVPWLTLAPASTDSEPPPIARPVMGKGFPLELKLGLIDAIDVARRLVPEGGVYHAEQELDRYSIDFAVGARTVNVVVDGNDGRVIEHLEEDGDHLAAVGMVSVSVTDAVRSVQRGRSGRPVEASILLLPGRAAIEVKLIRDGKAVWLDVDGKSGALSAERPRSLQPN